MQGRSLQARIAAYVSRPKVSAMQSTCLAIPFDTRGPKDLQSTRAVGVALGPLCAKRMDASSLPWQRHGDPNRISPINGSASMACGAAADPRKKADMKIDPATQPHATNYKLLTNLVVPQPIAWISTINQAGVINLAPFSFFNAVGSEPPYVVVSIGRRDDGAAKDTANNIVQSREFVVNLVTESLLMAMNISAADFPPDKSELTAVGLLAERSVKSSRPGSLRPRRVSNASCSRPCRSEPIRSSSARSSCSTSPTNSSGTASTSTISNQSADWDPPASIAAPLIA